MSSPYHQFQEIKRIHENRIRSAIQNVLEQFQEATGAPVHGVDVDVFLTQTMGDESPQVVMRDVSIRTEG